MPEPQWPAHKTYDFRVMVCHAFTKWLCHLLLKIRWLSYEFSITGLYNLVLFAKLKDC